MPLKTSRPWNPTVKQTLSPQPLKSNRNETRQSDGHGHFPSRFLADSDKTTPTHRILSWCKGRNLRLQISKWIWSTPDKAFVLGTIAITWHSVYIPDLNWGDSPVSSCCCRSFFKTVDKQRSESMSAVPRCPLINIIETCQHLLWDVNQFFYIRIRFRTEEEVSDSYTRGNRQSK